MLLYFLCSVDELILNHQLENNFSKAVFKYPVPLGHLELPSLRRALCVRQGCWATSLLTLILELYPPVVGCESLPLALPNVIFKPGALPSLRSCWPSSCPLAAPGVCRGGAAGCSALRFGVLRPPSPVAVWHHVPVPRSSKPWLVRNTFLQSPAGGNELPSAGSWLLEEVHVLPAAPAALSDATGSYSRRPFSRTWSCFCPLTRMFQGWGSERNPGTAGMALEGKLCPC